MRRALTLRARLIVPVLLLSLAACGGGGGGGDGGGAPPPPTQLTITTGSLPAGSVGETYAATQLQAAGVQGTATWTVDSGSLPSGLSLSEDGMITGTPTAIGSYDFVARVDDEITTDTRDLSVAVDVLGLTVTSGVTAGKAWSGRPVLLNITGQEGLVRFEATTNDSGGSFTASNPAAGTASWTPGATSGPGIVDTLLITDLGSNKSATVDIPAMPHPADGFTAAFGTSDVWYIDPTAKVGSHAYVSDFHHALVAAGFRDPSSTDALGTEADQLAALLIHLEVLRQVNPMFLRNADGTAGGSGLAITFPFEQPGAGYTAASAANSIQGSPTRYSVMGFTRGSQGGVIGTAFLDGTSNGWHENDTTDGTFELGVFANQIVPIVNSAYSNPLPNSPVAAGDVAALEALVYELASPGGRYNTLRRQARGLAKALAATVAHEIGHSCGLGHTNPSEPGSIMNASALIGPSSQHQFTSEDVAQLQGALPGAGKSGAPLTAAQKATLLGPRPIEVCRCRGCALKPAR